MDKTDKIPTGWAKAKISDLFDFIGGGTPSKKELLFWNGEIPWASVKDIKGSYLTSTQDSITEIGLANSAANIANPGEVILITRISPGKVITTKIKTAINQDLKIVRPKYDANPDFIRYLFNTLEKECIKLSSGTTVLGITLDVLNDINIIIPPLNEQNRIVDKLDELFSELEKGKEQLQTSLEQLKVYRQSILKHAFEGKLTNKNVKEGELPFSWVLVQLKEIVEVNPKLPGRELIENDIEVQFLPMKLVEEIVNKIHLTEIRKYKELLKGSYTPFINDDIIFAKVTPCMENGKIAIVKNLKNSIGFGSSEFHVLRVSAKILKEFVFYFVVQDRFRNEAQHAMTGAVGLRRVPKQFIENHLIPLPPLKEQQNIVDVIETKLSVCNAIEETILQALHQIGSLKQSILQKAFEGKLVEQDPTDEPASLLLERIKKEREEFLKAEKGGKKVQKSQ